MSRTRIRYSRNDERSGNPWQPCVLFFLSVSLSSLHERPHPLSESTFTAEITDPGRVQGRLRRPPSSSLSPLLGRASYEIFPRRTSSYDFSYLNRDGRALVSLTADDIPTGSKAIVARLCLHRERTSPLSVSLPPPPRLPPPRPFLSTLRLSFCFSLSTLFDRRSCFALQRIVISSL